MQMGAAGMGCRGVGITGIGIVGPTGIGKDAFWHRLVFGPSAITTIRRFDAASYPSRIAAQIEDVSYRSLIDLSTLRYASLTSQYALAAAKLALEDAHLDMGFYEPRASGVVLGTSLGGWHEVQSQIAILLEKGANRVNPFVLVSAPNHAPAMEVAILTRSTGAHATFSTGCCASTHAIGHGADLISRGEIDVCLVGGTEAPINPMVLAALTRTRELCCANEHPTLASRPFDKGHSGFVLSEGAAVLVLERLETAHRRGAFVYAEVLGFSSSIDASDPFRVDEAGIAGAQAVGSCLDQSDLAVGDVQYVCANGNSSPAFDRKDTAVLKLAFGSHVSSLPVSSIKGVLGHPFGAAGAFQVAACCLAMVHRLVPPTHNLEEPDVGCDLDYVPNVARQCDMNNVLICSYGFGGINACIALGRDVASKAYT